MTESWKEDQMFGYDENNLTNVNILQELKERAKKGEKSAKMDR